MKVLVAHFTSECNEHISHTVGLDEFHLLYGDECLEAMHIRDIFENILPYLGVEREEPVTDVQGEAG